MTRGLALVGNVTEWGPERPTPGDQCGKFWHPLYISEMAEAVALQIRCAF